MNMRILMLVLCLSFHFRAGLGLKLLAVEHWDTNQDATLKAKWKLDVEPDGGATKGTIKVCDGDGSKKYGGKGRLGKTFAWFKEEIKRCGQPKSGGDVKIVNCLAPIAAKAATMESDTITGFHIAIIKNQASTNIPATFFTKCVPVKNDALVEAGYGAWVFFDDSKFAEWAAWAKNDPIVKNIAGEQFEILATGYFRMLAVQELESERMMLEANATIDRAGTRCGATYIQDLSLKGEWVKDLGVPQIQIRAESAVGKNQALQVNFDGEWKHSSARFPFKAMRESNSQSFFLQLRKLKIKVSIDSHRIHERSQPTNRFANFLNVNFEGVSHLSDMILGGLLGRDSHEAAAQLPANCYSKTGKLFSVSDTAAMLSTALIV